MTPTRSTFIILDPGFGPTLNEIVTRLELSAFDPAIRNDVASTQKGTSLAQQLDAKHYRGHAAFGFVRGAVRSSGTRLPSTMPFKARAREELRFAVLSPGSRHRLRQRRASEVRRRECLPRRPPDRCRCVSSPRRT